MANPEYPKLIQQAIGLQGSEQISSPEEQHEADEICRQIYNDCDELLNRHGLELPTSKFNPKVGHYEQTQKKVRSMGVAFPDESTKGVVVTILQLAPYETSPIEIEMVHYSLISGSLLVWRDHGEMVASLPYRLSTPHLRRANLTDARRYLELIKYIEQHPDNVQNFPV